MTRTAFYACYVVIEADRGDATNLGIGARCVPRHPLHFLAQSQPDANVPVEGAAGVDGGVKGPIVPRRQLTLCHAAVSSIPLADVDLTSGMAFLRGRPLPVAKAIIATSVG